MRQLWQFPEGPIGGGGGPGPARTAVPAPRVTFGQSLGRVGEGVDALATMIEEDNLQASKIAAIEAKGAFRRDVEADLADMDPTAHDYLERAQQAIEGHRQARGASPGVVDPDIRDALELDLTTLGETFLTAAAAGRRTALGERALSDLEDETNATAGRIFEDPDAFGLHVADWEATAAVLFENIPPEQHDELREGMIKRALTSQIEGLADNGRFDEAREMLTAFGTDITDKERRSLAGIITNIENNAQNEFKSRTAELHAAHRIMIADVDKNAPDAVQQLDLIRERMEQSHAKGLYRFAPDKLASNIAVLMTKRAQALEASREKTVAAEKFQAGAILLQDELDDYVWPAVKQQLAADGADQETFLATLAEIGRTQGKLPSEITDRIAAGEFADNPTVLAQTTALHQRLKDANPRVDTKAGDVVKDVSLMKRLLNSSYEEAAKWVLDRQADPAERAKRAKAFESNAKGGDSSIRDVTAADILEGGEVVVPDLSFIPFHSGVELPALAEQEALELYREAYLRFGDKKAALDRTREAMHERWGVTRIGGGAPRLAQHPIERFLPSAVQPDPDVGHEGFSPDEQAAIVDQWVAKHVGGNIPEYRLVFTDRSRRQLAAGARHEYQLFEPDPVYGTMRPVTKRHKETGETSPVFIPVPEMDDIRELPAWKDHVAAQTNPGFMRRVESAIDTQVKGLREHQRIIGQKGVRRAIQDELGFARRREQRKEEGQPGAIDQIRQLFGG